MKDILDEIFGSQLSEYKKIKVSLPLYLKTGRSFYEIVIGETGFVLVSIDTQERLNVSALKKQLRKYYEVFNAYVVYGFPVVTTFQRKSLIENGISFVSGNGQVYLPFMGAFFVKCQMYDYRKESINLTPSAQALLLLMIYTDGEISKSHAAGILGIAPMSVTRASADLVKLGLISETRKGTEALITLNGTRMEVYEKARDYLISPVTGVVYIEKGEAEPGLPAGDYALSKRSDLGYPGYYEYAVSKKDYLKADHNTCDPYTDTNKELIRIQKWSYSPKMFAFKGQVDPISLISSYKGDEDERIHKCLVDVEKEIEKWQLTIS